MAQIIAKSLQDHRERSVSVLVVALIISLVVLTLTGTGTAAILSLVGIVLCVVCFFRREVSIDWWIFIPLAAYLVMNFVSAWAAYGDAFRGYGPLHVIYLTLYASACCLRAKESNLLRQLCVLFAGVAAIAGIVAFSYQAFSVSATRMEFVVGSPNALGIFFVLSWFALQSCRMSAPEGKLFKVIDRLEPVILVALAMTLSMGSFAALMVGFIVMLISRGRATGSAGEALRFATVALPKIFLGFGIGLLMYMSAERAEAPMLCLVVLAYLVAMVCLWRCFDAFLVEKRKVASAISIIGLLCIPLAIFMRPNALLTFDERIAMMANGIGYLWMDPLTGTGPKTWRGLNLLDGDAYFNTNHIHNMFIHAGVEFGLIAMIALIVIAVRLFVKRYQEAQHGEDAAFLFHMLTDTGFFFMGVVGMFIFTANGSTSPVKQLPSIATKLVFLVLALMHFAILWIYLASF